MNPSPNRIVDVREGVEGYKGNWLKPDGTKVPVMGTFALGPALSWYYHTGKVTESGFQVGEYVVVNGIWQF